MTATPVDMLLKCSNPCCASAFHSSRGSFFRYRTSVRPDTPQKFWLCEACSRTYTLNYVSGLGMQVVDRKLHDPLQSAGGTPSPSTSLPAAS
jgi:hypothetical protein